MKAYSLFTHLVLPLGLTSLASATTIASWDFTSATNPQNDTSGNGYNLSVGAGVSFNTTTGADFNGTNNGELSIAYNAALEPGSISAGETWTISLTGVQSDMTSGYGAVYSSRDNNGATGTGAIIYRNGVNGNWEFWTGTSSNAWNVINSGVSVSTSATYDLTASWDGTTMTFTVDDGNSEVTNTLSPGNVVFNSGNNGTGFGNGGDTSSEFFFDGRIQSATITVVPEPSSLTLIGLGSLALILRRRK
ncbi:PEP-CTERM sorting domain-containing protein [Verrucomicrobiaceae bacterium N1E253]|uniref:PEP-CTERM sorting domain-containing protein n=1 Tax=Oceaniferula marina TaxID=2748318 RepID=A0A851GF93_9BACT|nr:PEP-CTERM sorting domain-containing protein [Oceaniferula marina]NWK55869.1 PEP-CTERM sorting domain-containing protein [Oceaniferula marina]